jgi:hypothetical protein
MVAFYTLTDRPETARWLTAAEKEMAIARVQSERSTAGATQVLDKLDSRRFLAGIKNPHVSAIVEPHSHQSDSY